MLPKTALMKQDATQTSSMFTDTVFFLLFIEKNSLCPHFKKSKLKKIRLVLDIILSSGWEVERACWQGNILETCKMSVIEVGSVFILAYGYDGKS